MNRPILKRRSDAEDIAIRLAAVVVRLLIPTDYRLAYNFSYGLKDYWYVQVKKHGWRRLSGKRIEELNCDKRQACNIYAKDVIDSSET
jgi:hypothetical protein